MALGDNMVSLRKFVVFQYYQKNEKYIKYSTPGLFIFFFYVGIIFSVHMGYHAYAEYLNFLV